MIHKISDPWIELERIFFLLARTVGKEIILFVTFVLQYCAKLTTNQLNYLGNLTNFLVFYIHNNKISCFAWSLALTTVVTLTTQYTECSWPFLSYICSVSEHLQTFSSLVSAGCSFFIHTLLYLTLYATISGNLANNLLIFFLFSLYSLIPSGILFIGLYIISFNKWSGHVLVWLLLGQ